MEAQKDRINFLDRNAEKTANVNQVGATKRDVEEVM